MRRVVGFALLLAGSSLPALAQQPLRCSTFLHTADGGWRAFDEGDVLGPDGPVHVRSGEVLRPSQKGPKGEIGRALNGLCEGR